MANKTIDKALLARKIQELDGLSNEEKSALTQLINRREYGLVWEDKPEAAERKLKTQMPYLKEVTDKRIICEDPDAPNHIIIEGDNYPTLVALSYAFSGKIDLIYIDPPYNTGNEDFVYNDNYVGKDDDFRHSKWLSFMDKRLRLARKLLSDKGVLVISIGYQEVNNLVLLCQQIFKGKQVVTVTVQTSGGKPSGGFNYTQEYLVFVTREDFSARASEDAMNSYSSPYHGMTLATFNQVQRPNQTYPIYVDGDGNVVGYGKSLQQRIKEGTYTGEKADFVFDYDEAPLGCTPVWPVTKKGDPCVWRKIGTQFKKLLDKGYIKIIPQKTEVNKNKYVVQYLADGVIKKIDSGELKTHWSDSGHYVEVEDYKTAGTDIPTIWIEKEYFTTNGGDEIKDIFGKKIFSYPKPRALIQAVLERITEKNAYILDFFAGSGTTLHATMNLNAEEEDGHRTCIIVTNNENNICEEVTYERNRIAIKGYTTAKGEEIPGLSKNNLRYYKVDFQDRAPSYKNKRRLVSVATDLLCIKEDLYEEKDTFGGITLDKRRARYFEHGLKKMLVICDESLLYDFIEVIRGMVLESKIKVYVFSDSAYAYEDDFTDVVDKVEPCALPAAILAAYKEVLPKMAEQDAEGNFIDEIQVEDSSEIDDMQSNQDGVSLNEDESFKPTLF